MEEPSLCEPGVKYFIGHSLKESHKFKEKYMNYFYNIGMTLIFFGSIAGFLIYRYKGRITPQETALKNRQNKNILFLNYSVFQQ